MIGLITRLQDELRDLTTLFLPYSVIAFGIAVEAMLNLAFRGMAFMLVAAIVFGGLFVFARQPGSENDRLAFLIAKASAAIVVLQALAFAGEALGNGYFLGVLHNLLMAVILGAVLWLLHRYNLGWAVDENGERQRVLGHDRFGAIMNPTTHAMRRHEAFVARRKRLLIMAGCSAAALLLGTAAWNLYPQLPSSGIFVGALATIPALGAVACLVIEAVYQLGFQHMPGAKVLDDLPTQLGPAALADEMAYGAAGIATADEAHNLLERDQ